jgi:hypothetical protein
MIKHESIAKDQFFETIYTEDKEIINKANKLIKKLKAHHLCACKQRRDGHN